MQPLRKEILVNVQQPVFSWLKACSIEERQAILTISDQRMYGLIMATIGQSDFAKKGFQACTSNDQGPSKHFNELYARQTFRYKSQKQLKETLQTQLLRSLVTAREQKMISMCRSMVSDADRLQQILQQFTDDMIFRYERQTKSMVDASQWFKVTRYQSGCQWIVHLFECEVIKKWQIRQQNNSLENSIKLHRSAWSFQEYLLKAYKTNLKEYGSTLRDYEPQKLCFVLSKIQKTIEQKSPQQHFQDIAYRQLFSQDDPEYLRYCQVTYEVSQGPFRQYLLQMLQKQHEQREMEKKLKRRNKKKNRLKKKKEQQLANESIVEIEKSKHVEPEEEPVIEHVVEEESTTTISLDEQMHSKEEIAQSKTRHYEEQKLKKKIRVANNHLSQILQEFIDDVSMESNSQVLFRKLVFSRVEQLIKDVSLLYHMKIDYTLQLFGSCAIGLSTVESDIDAVLSSDCEKEVQENLMRGLAHLVRRIPWIKNSQLILNTTVPVLKLTVDIRQDYPEHPRLNLKEDKIKRCLAAYNFDLSVESRSTDNHLGMKSTNLIREALENDPKLRSLIIFNKMLLKSKGYHTTFLGGMNSYVLFLLIFAANKQFKLEKYNLFKATTEILRYYGQQFDYARILIDISQPKPLIKTDQLFERLTIVNPFGGQLKFVNTNCYKIREVQKTMEDFLKELQSFRTSNFESLLNEKAMSKNLKMSFKQLLRDWLWQKS